LDHFLQLTQLKGNASTPNNPYHKNQLFTQNKQTQKPKNKKYVNFQQNTQKGHQKTKFLIEKLKYIFLPDFSDLACLKA
jgi:hypothetical protein